jgi:stage V sporulation protein B
VDSEKIGSVSPYHTARGALYLIAKAFVASISGAIFYIFIARYLPNVSDLGLFQGLQALLAISNILAGSGLSRAAVRFISVYIGAGKEDKAEGLYSSIFRIGLISCLALSAIIYFSSHYIAVIFFHNAKYVDLIKLTSVDIFLYSIIIYLTSLFYALQAFKKAVTISIINYIVKYTVSSVLVLLGTGMNGIIAGFVIGDTLGVILFVYPLIPRLRKSPSSLREMKPLFNYSLPLYGSSILDYLSKELDVYLLLILTSLSIVGIYSPAVFLGTMLFLIQTSLDQSIAPFFSRIYGKSGIKVFEDLSKLASRYIFLIYFPIGFITLSCTPILLTDILGDRYTGSIYPSIVIILAITVTSNIAVFNNILMSKGHTGIFLKTGIVTLSVQIVISLIAIPHMGALGAAIAKGSSYVIVFLIPAYVLKRITGLHYDRNALKVGLAGSIVAASIIFGLNIYLHHFYYLPISIVIGFLSYLLFLRFSRIVDSKDLQIINKILFGKADSLIAIIAKVVIR